MVAEGSSHKESVLDFEEDFRPQASHKEVFHEHLLRDIHQTFIFLKCNFENNITFKGNMGGRHESWLNFKFHYIYIFWIRLCQIEVIENCYYFLICCNYE